MMGPATAVAIVLLVIAIVANCFTLLYFALFGWLCETEICDCIKPFISEALATPWELPGGFLEKIFTFLCDK